MIYKVTDYPNLIKDGSLILNNNYDEYKRSLNHREYHKNQFNKIHELEQKIDLILNLLKERNDHIS